MRNSGGGRGGWIPDHGTTSSVMYFESNFLYIPVIKAK